MPSLPWKKWKKPWTRDQCGRRYIEGEKITVRALAVDSGNSESSINRWSPADQWVAKREQFQSDLRAKTREKTIEVRSDAIANQQLDLLEKHSKTNETFRQLANMTAQLSIALAQEKRKGYIAKPDGTQMSEAEKQSLADSYKFLAEQSRALSLWMGIAERAIGGERIANFLDNVDPRMFENDLSNIPIEDLELAIADGQD